MLKQPELSTERLLLRPFQLEDSAAVQRLAGAWEVADTTANMPHPYEDGMAEAWIAGHAEAFKAGEEMTYAMVLKGSGELLGAMGMVLDRGFLGELGYWVGLPYWGRGYCTEAGRAVLTFAFDGLGLQRVFARVFRRNPASARVLEKLGMDYEGTQRQQVLRWGRPEDIILYGLLRADWERGRKPL
ncbi:MAG: GNAT family N-acetyltransferase [Gammaproteobacteria bacterium]|nr:GNAT family N-acetyltransferase [Pseudomonadales bacterium]MCP5347468.1 GNAT family N-acetyltransferase [Pseudomonadales bacterium]